MNDAFKVNVLGQTFYLKGEHDQAYIERVEKYLNDKIEEVRSAGGTVDSYNLMILVALNLVDDCLKKEDEAAEVKRVLDEKSDQLINLIDSHM